MQHSVGLSEPYFSDLEGRPSSFCNQYLVSSAKVSTQPSAFPANLRHVGVPSAPSHHSCEPTARDPHRRPRISPATIEASSGSLRAGRWRGPSALAASVCDGSCWPRALLRHRFLPRDLSESFRACRSRAVWPWRRPSASGGRRSARRRSLSPKVQAIASGRPREPAAGQSDAAAPPQARRAAQRRSPAPPARRSQR